MRTALIAIVTTLTLGWTLAPPPGPAFQIAADARPAMRCAGTDAHHRGLQQGRHHRQKPGHHRHDGADGNCQMPPYSPTDEEILDVEVLEVQRMEHRGSERVGIHLRVRIDDREAMVHLGPESFLAEEGLEPEAGMTLQITGSWVDHRGERIVLARTVNHSGRDFELRDADGRPLWAGCPGCR